MRRAALIALVVLALAGCSRLTGVTPVNVLDEHDYQWHKHTTTIKVHWNYLHPDEGTIVADGFVEPFDHTLGVFAVNLELVGLDAEGNIVNSASGRPSDNTIASPYYKSYFGIKMKLNGKEKDFTVRGNYYYFVFGTRQSFSSRFYQVIPLHADEPY